MKKLTVTALIIAICLSSNAMAKNNSYYDYARVIQTTPIFDHVTNRVPVQDCRYGKQHEPRGSQRQSAVPTVVGGLIGGAVGHALGAGKTNKQVGLVAGTVLGAAIAADFEADKSQHRSPDRSPGRICTTRYHMEEERILIGYDVTYRYHGNIYHDRTKHHPGDRIKVKVMVDPVKSRHGKGDRHNAHR